VDIRLRPASAADAEAIASLLRRSFAEYESLYTIQGFSATTIPRDEVPLRMRQGPIWVALVEDGIVGTASAVKKEDSLYIRGMAVLPYKRGARIGELLLIRLEEYAANEGRRRLILACHTTSDASRLHARNAAAVAETSVGRQIFLATGTIHRTRILA